MIDYLPSSFMLLGPWNAHYPPPTTRAKPQEVWRVTPSHREGAATERMPRPTLRVPEALPAPPAHRHVLEGTRPAAGVHDQQSRRRSASPPRNQAAAKQLPPPPRAAAAPYFVSRPTNTFANATSPGLITSRITKSQDLESLCALLETGGDFAGFQTIAISAAIHRLGKFACKHDHVRPIAHRARSRMRPAAGRLCRRV